MFFYIIYGIVCVLLGVILGALIERHFAIKLASEEIARYVTKSGRVLTDEEIEKFAAEAVEGYDVGHLKK